MTGPRTCTVIRDDASMFKPRHGAIFGSGITTFLINPTIQYRYETLSCFGRSYHRAAAGSCYSWDGDQPAFLWARSELFLSLPLRCSYVSLVGFNVSQSTMGVKAQCGRLTKVSSFFPSEIFVDPALRSWHQAGAPLLFRPSAVHSSSFPVPCLFLFGHLSYTPVVLVFGLVQCLARNFLSLLSDRPLPRCLELYLVSWTVTH